MRVIWLKRVAGTLILVGAAAGIGWFTWPRPIPVDLARVTLGPMEVTVDDEARTRVRHVYTVSAPVAGKALRISHPAGRHETSLHVGDQVTAGETVVAVMQPTLPSFLDIRSREELQAAVTAADAAVKLAEAEVRRIEAALAFSRDEHQRAQTLVRTGAISSRAVDKAQFDVDTNEAALASAKAQLDVRRSEQAVAAARLIDPSGGSERTSPNCCIEVRAPVTGRILRIIQESEAVVLPGAPLLAIGDPLDLEVAADLLSTDAVQVKPGAQVRIDGWGGPSLRGRVTRVDPAGFVKVSALGIEEQRVQAVIDFVDPPEAWSALGHDFRVIVHVTTWRANSALTVPVSALFRSRDDWAVFAVREGRAHTVLVRIGHRNSRQAEVLSGLSVGDSVVLHPSDRIRDGVTVSERDGR
ncbi:efflux RND transporter periplasmic adaptor subunit [Microvirga yunnanensis]|uniref:efflux RND transporter periplasmic adaptor subunit n=1 Tax=Microvirga yunnanensis TaxID=2953740 RepID=UPI0021C6C23F|nr:MULTISPECIES: HlyD family efflux transporter periplasmic adaptor subunit [unclassified Microvirga]